MSNEKTPKKQTFLQGAAILAMATIIVKLLGFAFKVPLNNTIGKLGNSYFYTAYKVYDVLLMISTTGLPVAMSRMISEAQTLENYAQIQKIYKTARYVFLTIGIVGMLGMLLFCRQLSVMVTTNENSWAAIAALSPCVLLVCVISAYRGFFQGQSNMSPTSISQIFESVIRLVVGLGAAWFIMRKTGSAIYAAGGAICGVSLGSLVSALYLRRQFKASNGVLSRSGGQAKSTRATMKELLAIAVPITLGAAGLQLINLFDTMIYMRRLTGALGYSETLADGLKGIYDFQLTVFALPCALITPITISSIPNITSYLTAKNFDGARRTEESAIRVMGLIALPCTIGLVVLGTPIVDLLCTAYTPEDVAVGGRILSILGFCVLSNSMVLVFNAMMQAHGDVTTPVINMLIGGVVKVIVNYILVAVPSLNIVGAPIGTLVCYTSIAVLDLIAMRRSVTTRPAVWRNIIRPAVASVLMGVCAWLSYQLLTRVVASTSVACLGAVVIAVVAYAVLIVVLQCVTYEDCMLLPKGEKIAKLLHIKQKT